MDMLTHIAQFRLHFYRKDSIIESKQNLNCEYLYCPDDDKVYINDWRNKEEQLLKEMGNYTGDAADCGDDDYHYFHTPKDVFYVEFLHEIGDFDYDDTNNHITKWLDEMFQEDELVYDNMIRLIYNDVKEDIDSYFENRTNSSKFIFERLVNLQSHNYTTGYEYVEYECDISYMGIYKLHKPQPMTGEELFEKQHVMSSTEFYKNINY